MTDWRCERCRRYVRIYRHFRWLKCSACRTHMRRGAGKGSTFDPWEPEREARDTAPAKGRA